jgi:hypothetical protein
VVADGVGLGDGADEGVTALPLFLSDRRIGSAQARNAPADSLSQVLSINWVQVVSTHGLHLYTGRYSALRDSPRNCAPEAMISGLQQMTTVRIPIRREGVFI